MRDSARPRNYWCDCIRGYAILLVCASHLPDVDPAHDRWGFLALYIRGDTGVFLFYVLSGFLVTGILAREVAGQAQARLRIRAAARFFARRVFRLQPTHLLFLGCYALLPHQEGALAWWVLVFPLSNWFSGPYITWHLKTLHIEEQYYASIGVLSTLFWKRLRPILWCILFWAPVGRVASFVAMKHGSHAAAWFLDHYPPFEAFAGGGLLSLYLKEVRGSTIGMIILSRPKVVFALAIIGLVLTGVLRPVKPFSYVLLLTWPTVFSAFSALAIFAGLDAAPRPFAAEWLRKLGLASYTVYLFQQFGLGPWNETFQAPFSFARWLSLIAVTCVLVPLWYVYVEKRLTEYGARLFPRLSQHGE